MDPASILALTAACLGITRNTASFISALNNLVSRLRDTELDLSAIDGQTSILGLVAERLRHWIVDHENELSEVEREPLWRCVSNCETLVTTLRDAVSKVSNGQKAPNLWRRARTVFAQPQLERYARTLEQQGNTLNLFLQVFQVTSGPRRSIELQNENTKRIIENTISSASDTTSEICSRVSSLDSISDDRSDKDSGYSEPSSVSTSSRRRSRLSILSSVFEAGRSGLARSRRDRTEAVTATRFLDQASLNSNQAAPRNEHSSGRINLWVTSQSGAPGAPGAPGGDDEPPPSSSGDDSDNESNATSRGPRRLPSVSDISRSSRRSSRQQPPAGDISSSLAGAPGAPGGDDGPPPSSSGDDSDNESNATARGPRRPPSVSDISRSSRRSSRQQPPAGDISSSLADMREQLEILSSSSSSFGDNVDSEEEVEKIRLNLIRLQEIMLNLRRIASEPEGPVIPEAMERQIEALFDKVRENCKKVRACRDEDEIILRGRDIYRRNLDGETALHIAAKRKPPDTAAISRFLRLGASVQSLDIRSATPLRSMLDQMVFAKKHGEQYARAVKILLDAGADANTTTTTGTSLLSLWCLRATNHDSVSSLDLRLLPLESLFTYPINVNATDRSLLTPLHHICEQGWKSDAARLLISRGANVHARTPDGDTALDILFRRSRSPGWSRANAEILLSAGAIVSPRPSASDRLTPLDHVVSRIYPHEGNIISNPGKYEDLTTSKMYLIEAMSEMHLLLRHLVEVCLHPSSTTSWDKSYVLRELVSLKAGSLQVPAYRMDKARLKLQNEIGRIVCTNLLQLQTDFSSYRGRSAST